jgi:putative nucleotidyltransferase with HDIG domain
VLFERTCLDGGIDVGMITQKYVSRTVEAEDLKAGMVVDRMLLTDNGRVFLRAGAVLDDKLIEGLKKWGFRQVEIREECVKTVERKHFEARVPGNVDERLQELEAEDDQETVAEDAGLADVTANYSEESASDPIVCVLPEDFVATYNQAVLAVKNEYAKARFLRDSFDVENMQKIVTEKIKPLLSDSEAFWKLQFVRRTEDYLYHHSVDVSVLAGLLGQWCGCAPEKVEKMMFGGLLHDLGKALVPLKVVNKPGELNSEEWNMVRRHPVRGYKFLRKNFDIPKEVLYCIVQHHERIDGCGYPLGISGGDIDFMGRVVAVADVFSAMTSPRCYGKQSTAFAAAAAIRSEIFGKLDPQICNVLLDKLRGKFRSSVLRLSNGRTAEVVYLNESDDESPLVQVETGEVVDLKVRRDLRILKVLK